MSKIEALGPRLAVDLNLEGWSNVRWLLAAPLRWYLRHWPSARGKSFVRRRLYVPMLPAAGDLIVHLPQGPTLAFGHRDRIGVRLALHGRFESAELECVTRAAIPGSVCIDVGANVGFYTLAMSAAVGPAGRVLAIEPLPRNAEKLLDHVTLNRITNVQVIAAALGREPGIVTMDCDGDPAFATIRAVSDASEGGLRIEQGTLDRVWGEAGHPEVSVLKIDVEGAEPEVIAGGREMLRATRPVVLCEANSPQSLRAVEDPMRELGFERSQPRGFEPWNYLFRRHRGAGP